MLRTVLSTRSLFQVLIIPAIFVGPLFFASGTWANVLPEAIVYFNVRPLGSPEERCLTDIDDCYDMRSSTPEEGMLEFQLFIDPQQEIHGAIPVTHFAADLNWPEAWTVVDWSLCRDCYWCNFDVSGPSPHHLEVDWPCYPVPDGMFLTITIVFDVQDYGKFDAVWDCPLTLGCPPDEFVVYAWASSAEAGTECEYTNNPCGDRICEPGFTEESLVLTGVEGGTTHGETDFWVGDLDHCSGWSTHCGIPWITARVETGDPYWHKILIVDADLTEVTEGYYESKLQVEDGSVAARCLPIIVKVESASAVGATNAGRSASVALDLQLASGNPFSGPFDLVYENPAAAWVRCGVYDASGREVARLLDGERPSGSHTITWNAIAAGGDRVPPGVYVIRLDAGGVVRSSRVVVLR